MVHQTDIGKLEQFHLEKTIFRNEMDFFLDAIDLWYGMKVSEHRRSCYRDLGDLGPP